MPVESAAARPDTPAMIIRRIAAVAALLSLLLAAPLWAQDKTPAEIIDGWDKTATRAEEVLAAGEASTSALEVMRESLVEQRAAARAMVAEETKKLAPFRQQLEALGPKPAEGVEEAPEVVAARLDLNQKIETVSGRLKKAELALARVDGLIKQLDGLIRGRFTNTLLSTGPSPLSPWRWVGAVAEYLNVAERLAAEGARGWEDPVAKRNRETRLPALAIATVLSVLLIVSMRRWLSLSLRRGVVEGAGRGRRLAVGLVTAAMRLVAPLIVLALCILALRQSGLIGPTASLLQDPFIGGLVAVIVAYGLGQVIFAPGSPQLRIAPMTDAEARRGGLLAGGLGVVVFLEAVLVNGGAQINIATSALAVANLPIVMLGGFLLFRLARLIMPHPPTGIEYEGEDRPSDQLNLARRVLRIMAFVMMAAAILSPVVAALGYFAASRFILYPVIMSISLFAATFILFVAFREAVDAYVEENELEAPGLRLLSILLGFLLGCAAIPVLALIWGARVADLSEWWRLFADGLKFGEVTISPVDFLKFALVFTIGYSLTRLVQGVLRMSVLPNTRLDSGARVAIVSGAGYLGFFLAALAAIAATGLDLSNIAIVAGALSVGIGFGLQNIVNNFVSGIILLIERPIKAGDWIDVGGKQGYVTQISVRATEIETFDRATLIVPNSELISNSVMNMTHSNTIGRVHVPVGVAYGTDTRKVESVLLDIAKAHPMVLKRPAPVVIFQAFGADSLDFEIRAFLRDVNFVLATKSDMNFEIDRRFREEGIEIPFAQRDLHIKNVGELGETIRAAVSNRRPTRKPAAEPPAERSAETPAETAAETTAALPAEPKAEPKPPARRTRKGRRDGDMGDEA
jgi:small-conductance mechanosensitive channel